MLLLVKAVKLPLIQVVIDEARVPSSSFLMFKCDKPNPLHLCLLDSPPPPFPLRSPVDVLHMFLLFSLPIIVIIIILSC